MAQPVPGLDMQTAAYIAGLVDGEGSITLTRALRNENRRIVVSISNNELAILRFVLSATGTGKITSKRKSKEHHAESFTYQVSSRQALALLRQIVGYMNSYKARRATRLGEILATDAEKWTLQPRAGARQAQFRSRFPRHSPLKVSIPATPPMLPPIGWEARRAPWRRRNAHRPD